MADDETGLTAISHYRILTKLRASSMGDVYLGEDTRLGRPVAVKLLPASFQYDSDRRSRLLKEAGAAAGLRSPNVVLIYDVGEHEGSIFVVMEYVDGEMLSKRLKNGPLPISEAVDVALQVAQALHEAHSHGIVHGDMKSSGLIITERRLVKVLDFGFGGVAAHRDYCEQPEDVTVTLGRETVADFVSQTVSYVSPEQALGHPIDGRSDIFSLGVVVYEMVTGRVPFEGRTSTEIVERIIHHEAPPVSRLSPDVPMELARIVHKCLEKEKDRRYQSALELTVELNNLKRLLASGEAKPAKRAPTAMASAQRKRQHRKRVASLAVLPLANAGGDPDAEYLSEGITENIINSLSQLPRLRVAARSTVFRYKNVEADPRRVGRELEVAAVLTGKVLLRGDTLTLTAELVDAVDGSLIWGQQYHRTVSDIFEIQEAMSREITENLRIKLTGDERKRLRKRYTENAAAYQQYLKGRYYWNKRTEEGLRKGIEHFELAIAEDPVFALAYSGLADCYSMLFIYGIAAPAEVLPKARAAAIKALEIDDTLAEAHTSMGAVAEMNWQWSISGKEYKRALDLNRNYPTAHQWYAEYLAGTGRLDEALAEMARAQLLDPLSSIINTSLGWILFFAGRIDEAIDQYRSTIELDPDFAPAHWRLGEAYARKGLFDEALVELQTAVRLSGSDTHILARLGHGYATSGNREEACKVITELKERSNQQYVSPYEIAIVYAGLKDLAKMFEWLEKAYEDRSNWLSFLGVEPVFDTIRSDPRFTGLMRRIGLLQRTQSRLSG